MHSRLRTRRFFFFLLLFVVGAIGTLEAIGCDTADLTTPPDCRGPTCTCEQDPSQPRCRGFSPEDDAAFEGGAIPDSPIILGDGGGDAPSDAKADVHDAADGG
jgi:hypothetical protein